MTYPTYSQQQLQQKSLDQLRQIYSEIGCTAHVMDRRCKDAWMNAIARYQTSKLEKVAPAAPDEQTAAQAELDHYITTQAQTIAPEELTPVEISFYDHEYYWGDILIAAITHDHADFVTQPWLVTINGKEVHRANTWAKCHNFITWHHKDGSLPAQEQDTTATTTGNEVMAQIFTECEKFKLDIMDDGIYRNNQKLGEVGYSNGKWWFIRAEDETHQRIHCDSALEAVWWLSMVDISLANEGADEYLQYRPLEQMTSDELQRLLEPEAVAA
ncbi:hypothetical protein VB735_34495 [Halotia wernerae UHCC 0503]|nr:hypothetical protein [Halotia wernerae UHCC 0503]